MVIGFWNVNNNTDLSDLLVDFVKENDIDILLLAETERGKKRKTISDDIILDFIVKSKNQNLKKAYSQLPDLDFKVKALTSLSPSFFTLKKKLFKSTRWSAYFVDIPSLLKFNLFPVHFHSKVNWHEFSQALECVNFSRDINLIEEDTKCGNSILIGDFNMNPFEYGIVASNGINAIPHLEYASRRPKGRKVDGSFYKYFYNPMWNHFGDREKPMTTHYHRPSGHISHEYHMLDQIILRSSFKPYLHADSIKIITKIAGQSLNKSFDRPNKEQYSDHFPILLDLKV